MRVAAVGRRWGLSAVSSSGLITRGVREHSGCGGGPSKGTLKDLADVFIQNEEWRQAKLIDDPNFFDRLKSNHDPKYLWIGCADARVPANQLMGEEAGTVFVHRNIGNQVLSSDMSMMSTVQYAVEFLKVPHIIVCGHYDCGALKAASSNRNHGPSLEHWLASIRDVRRIHRQEILGLSSEEERHRRLVELNVLEGCLSVFKTPVVQQRRVETHEDPAYPFTMPRIHPLVYDPGLGRLERLKVNLEAYLDEFGNIYDMYGKGATGDSI